MTKKDGFYKKKPHKKLLISCQTFSANILVYSKQTPIIRKRSLLNEMHGLHNYYAKKGQDIHGSNFFYIICMAVA